MLILLLGVGILGAIRDNRFGGDVTWAKSYSVGLKEARQAGRPLLLVFHTPGCGWCAKMDAETFTDPRVVELAQRFVWVRLDSDVDTDLVARYHVVDYPTIVVQNPPGNSLVQFSGYVPPDQFVRMLHGITSQH